MKDRPILFSAPMVRALLNCTKSQTRRAVKLPTPDSVEHGGTYFLTGCPDRELFREIENREEHLVRCPYGQPGDRLWVREAFRTEASHDAVKPSLLPIASTGKTLAVPFWYDADLCGNISGIPGLQPGKYRPGMFMPRAASRILLEIVSVRVERLQDISEADAEAEGIETVRVSETDFRYVNYLRADRAQYPKEATCGRAVQSYATLWESINGPGSWGANPWVWVVEFKRVMP